MRIDYVNQRIMDVLLAGYPAPRYTTAPASDGKKELHIVAVDGFVAYVLDPCEVYFNLARCRKDSAAFKMLQHDETLCRIDNMLEPTMDVRVAGPGNLATALRILNGESASRLLTRFKGAAWDTFVDMDLLEAFDDAKYYQAKENGPIAVVEDGCLVGYVMPTSVGNAEGHYTDSPTHAQADG